jgi:hypothetical protein
MEDNITVDGCENVEWILLTIMNVKGERIVE